VQIVLLNGGLQEARHQRVQDFLADISGKAGLDDAERRLAWAEAGQARFPLNLGSGTLRFLVHLGYGDRDLQRMLAAFY
jgi:hypothetical protein